MSREPEYGPTGGDMHHGYTPVEFYAAHSTPRVYACQNTQAAEAIMPSSRVYGGRERGVAHEHIERPDWRVWPYVVSCLVQLPHETADTYQNPHLYATNQSSS